jgi:hypothetical protein
LRLFSIFLSAVVPIPSRTAIRLCRPPHGAEMVF